MPKRQQLYVQRYHVPAHSPETEAIPTAIWLKPQFQCRGASATADAKLQQAQVLYRIS